MMGACDWPAMFKPDPICPQYAMVINNVSTATDIARLLARDKEPRQVSNQLPPGKKSVLIQVLLPLGKMRDKLAVSRQ